LNFRATLVKLRKPLLIAVVFASLLVVFFHEWTPALNGYILYYETPVDAMQVNWNAWHFAEKASQFQDPFHTDHQLFPNEVSLWMHAYTPIYGLINWFVQNPSLAIAMGMILNFLVLGWGFYRLGSNLGLHPLNAFMLAAFMSFNTYMVAKSGIHLNLILSMLLPFMLLNVMRVFQEKGGRMTFVMGRPLVVLILLLFAHAFLDYYPVFYTLSFLVLWVLYWSVLRPWWLGSKRWKWLVAAVVLIGGHMISRLLRITGVPEKGALWGAADIRQAFLPSELHAFGSEWALEVFRATEHPVFLGWGLMFLVVGSIAIYVRRSDKRPLDGFLLTAAAVYFMVVFPNTMVDGQPYFYWITSLIHYVPFVNEIRVGSRFVMMLYFCLAWFGLRQWQWWCQQYSIGPQWILLWIPLLLVSHLHRSPFALNTRSHLVLDRTEPAGKRVLHVPFGIRDGYRGFGYFDSTIYLNQVQYGHKNVSGYFSRVPETAFERAKNDCFLNRIVSLQNRDTSDLVNHWDSAQVAMEYSAFLKEYPVDFILVRKEYLESRPKLHQFLRDLPRQPVYYHRE
jgi:hypothetical protein